MSLGIWTWGSCRHSHVIILYPSKLDLANVTGRPGEHVIDLQFMVLRYTNNDSRKNINRKIEILEVKSPVVIRHYGATSCNPSSRFDHVYLLTPPNNVTELEIKEKLEERVIEKESKTVKVTELIRYVDVPNGVVEIERKTVRVDTLEYKKYVLRANILRWTERAIIRLYGDTFPVKEKLKELGYKWDGVDRTWKKIVEDNNNVIEMEIARLKEIGNVDVEVV